MIGRLITVVLVIWTVFLLLRRLLPGKRTAPPQGNGGRRSEPVSGGMMVRDPVCNTYIPLSSAIAWKPRTGQTHHFCSEACKKKFLKTHE